jgi:hypothetical protein
VYVRIVTFCLDGVSESEYRARAEHLALGIREWPGLLRKVWLADRGSGRFGGVYLFTDRAAADRSRNTELFRAMAAHPHFVDLRVEEFDVLDAATDITTLTTA